MSLPRKYEVLKRFVWRNPRDDISGPEWDFLAELLTEYYAHVLHSNPLSNDEFQLWCDCRKSDTSNYSEVSGHVYSLRLKFWQDGPSSKIIELLPQIPVKLPHLQFLTVEYDFITELPETFRHLKAPNLSFGGKQLQIPDDFFADFSHSFWIEFSNMPMDHLPPSLASCPNLHSISLFLLPNLTALPPWLSRLNLNHLSLQHCANLSTLPDIFDHFPHLQNFTLKYCPLIITLPPTLRALPLKKFRYVGHLGHVKDAEMFRSMSNAQICDWDVHEDHYSQY